MNRIAWSMSTALLLSTTIAAFAHTLSSPRSEARRTCLPKAVGMAPRKQTPHPGPLLGKERETAGRVAAVVDGHVIPMESVVRTCLREDREYVVGQLIQAYVIDREARRRKIVVSEKEIDARVADFAKAVAPSTVAATIAKHQMSMPELRDSFRIAILRDRLTESAVKPTRMVHCRQIRLRCTPETEDAAKAKLTELAAQVKAGADFGKLAAQYGEKGTADLGVLYDKMLNVDAPVLEAGLKLAAGQSTPQPVRTSDGYALIQAVSTGDRHPATENALYRSATQTSRKQQIMFLQPKVVGDLIDKCKIVYVKDADIAEGRPLPAAAATVDGHPIPMSNVVRQCVINVGHIAANIAVENFVVDRECKRRGITATDAEIDAQVDMLRRRIAPETLEQGLAAHHTTLAGLRGDFRQQIERSKLVIDTVAAPAMVHPLVIFAKSDASATDLSTHPSVFTKDQAQQKLEGDLMTFDHGAPFEVLAKRDSQLPNNGDLGIVYNGSAGVDTAMLNTALGMKTGGTTPSPVQTYGGWFLLRVLSTSADHSPDEEPAYASALAAYRRQQADRLAPAYVNKLVATSKVVNYLP